MLLSVLEMEGIYATGGHSLFDHASLAEFKYLAFPHYCMLLDCESLIHVDFIPLFVLHVCTGHLSTRCEPASVWQTARTLKDNY